MRGVDRTQVPGATAAAAARVQAPAANDPASMPVSLAPQWSTKADLATKSDAVAQAPIAIEDLIVIPESQGLRALDVQTGEERWHYRRDIDLCALSSSDGLIFATFKGPAGCGETVSLQPATGEYVATRRSVAPGQPATIRSNTYAGIYSERFLELWRNDLVRVVEYGDIPAAAEPKLQPHPECSIISALTRVEFLAVLNDCSGQARLVLQDSKPEESRKPEVAADIELGRTVPGMRLAAVGQDTAAVVRGTEILSYRSDGTLLSSTPLPANSPEAKPALPAQDDTQLPRAPYTADLPHHMTWFSAAGLIGFNPNELDQAFVFPEATGTPAPWGKHILMPVSNGIAVIDGDALKVIGTLPLPAELQAGGTDGPSASEQGPTALAVIGDTLVVQRGKNVSALRIIA